MVNIYLVCLFMFRIFYYSVYLLLVLIRYLLTLQLLTYKIIKQWSLSLVVRTPGFHPGDTGSNPVEIASAYECVAQ